MLDIMPRRPENAEIVVCLGEYKNELEETEIKLNLQ
jgi:hypothetical protein